MAENKNEGNTLSQDEIDAMIKQHEHSHSGKTIGHQGVSEGRVFSPQEGVAHFNPDPLSITKDAVSLSRKGSIVPKEHVSIKPAKPTGGLTPHEVVGRAESALDRFRKKVR